MSDLYLMGMSKNNIYSTMQENGLNVKRQEVRKYLKTNMRGKTSKHSRYQSRYKNAMKMYKKGMIDDVKEERDRLNKNYLTYVTINLLSDKKIRYSKEFKKIAVKNLFTDTWESP